MLTRILVTTCIFFFSYRLPAQPFRPSPSYKLIRGTSFVQSKNYYLLTLLQENREVRKMLEADAVLTAVSTRMFTALSVALKDCTGQASCFTDRMKFTQEEINEVSGRFRTLYADNNALGRLVRQELIPSGTYVLFDSLTPKDLLARAWEQDANGLNFTIGVYAQGRKPNYPNIDSASLPVHTPQFAGFAYSVAYLLTHEYQNDHLFFSLPLAAALRFLEMNERDNAADYEPMTARENKAACDRIASVKWDTYKYSVILVPGAGPEEPSAALSAEGMLRCRLAALQYRKGVAPFIMVSGGKVHPYKTAYCEAIEMKKFLMEKLGIPEQAIIAEPHARHTTTNMRNCARLIFRYNIPFSKPGIVCTTRSQSMAVTTTLANRCWQELHEVPYRNGTRLSETESEFFPLPEALHINPSEPMDP